MSPAAVSLATIFAIVAIGVAIGFLAGVHRKMDLEQWTVGGRGFGVVLVFLLMAGEVYTTFAFLGASGWAYSRGGPTLYVLAYLTLAYVVSFFILPQIWELGRRHGMQTESDFFSALYRNKYLAGFVCLVGIVSYIPYLQLQLTGVGIIVSIASFDGIGRTPAMAIAVVLLVAFVFASGVRAVAWVSVVKDALMVLAAISIGIGIPLIHFGGIGPMFAALAHSRPSHLTMPGATANLGHRWYVSTVLLTSLGFYMWPHSFAASFTAKSADTLRRNAVVMPLYTLTLAFIFFAGFAAVLIVPGLPNGDLGLFGLAACSQDFSVQPPSGEPMTVSDIGTHSIQNFAPADAPYQRIAAWVAANRTGWSQYLGSPPSSGTMISYGNVSLQFVDNQVLARAPAGIYQKATTVNVGVLLR